MRRSGLQAPGWPSTRATASPMPRLRPRLVLAVISAVLVALAVSSGWAASRATPTRPRIVARPIAFPAARKLEMKAYAKRHYGLDTWRLRNPKVIVEHITVSSTFALGVRHLQRRRRRLRAARAAGHLRPLRDRHRRDDLPARLAAGHVPPHGRPQLDRDRDRARRHDRRAGALEPAPDGLVTGAHDLADEPLPRQARRRDRPQREPHEPLSPGALRGLALPDPRRLGRGRHERLSRPARDTRPQRAASRSAAPSTT